MTRGFALLVVLAWAVLTGTAHAQHMTASVAAGASSVQFEGHDRFTAVSLSPAVRLQGRHVFGALGGTLSQLGAAGWSQQGTMLLSTFTGISAQGLLGEVSGSVGGSRFPDGFATAQGLGSARLHWIGRAAGVWLGGGAGAMYDGVTQRALRQGEVGASISREATRFTIAATPTETDDDLSYTDFLAALSFPVGALDLSGSLGGRAGSTLPLPGGDQRMWGNVAATLWLRSRLALTAGVGTYPVDPTQGFPAGRYVSTGLRFGSTRSLSSTVAVERRTVRREAAALGVRAFAIRRVSEGRIEIRVLAPGASRVEVQGDPTRWRVAALTADPSGWWVGEFDMAGAVVELVVRVDGGRWLVPPGAESVRDEFGGHSGRVVIPSGQ
jgi:hypothetical protein